MIDDVELKACPFCGGTKLKNCTDDGPAWTQCMTCEATGPVVFKYQEDGPDWNTRARPVSTQEQREAVAIDRDQLLGMMWARGIEYSAAEDLATAILTLLQGRETDR